MLTVRRGTSAACTQLGRAAFISFAQVFMIPALTIALLPLSQANSAQANGSDNSETFRILSLLTSIVLFCLSVLLAHFSDFFCQVGLTFPENNCQPLRPTISAHVYFYLKLICTLVFALNKRESLGA